MESKEEGKLKKALKPFIGMVGLFLALSFMPGEEVNALTLDKEGNYQLGGYLQNLSGIRLKDGTRLADGTRNYEAGDLSMFRNELFLDLSARISYRFQFKAIGRGHYEGVWGLDDDVNQLPKDKKARPGPHALDMESDFDFREYYMTIREGDFLVKLGRQQVAWGEADAIPIADVVNPLDLSWRWSFPTWEEIRIPLHMLNAFYTVPGSAHELKFELVYIPADFRPHNFAYPGANWDVYSNIGLPNAVGEMIFDQMEEDLPDNNLSNPQGGVRVRALLGPWDTYWFVFYGRDKAGVSTVNLDDVMAGDPLPLRYEFPYTTTIGMTFNVYAPWLETVFRGEAGYVIDQPFTADLIPGVMPHEGWSPFDIGEFDTLEVMIGFDYNAMIPFLNRTKSFFFSGQVDNKYIFDFDEDQYRSFFGNNDHKDWRILFSLLINTEYMEGKIVPQVLGVSFLNEESGFFDANVTYKPTFTLSFALGYTGIWGNENNAGLFFGPIQNNDEVYARIKWSF